MSQTILGLDVGATSVKVTVLETSFRSTHIVDTFERALVPVQPPVGRDNSEGEDSVDSRLKSVVATLQDLKNEGRLEGDTIITSFPATPPFIDSSSFLSLTPSNWTVLLDLSLRGRSRSLSKTLCTIIRWFGSEDSGARVLVVATPSREVRGIPGRVSGNWNEPKMIGVGASSMRIPCTCLRSHQGAPWCWTSERSEQDILVADDGMRITMARTLRVGGDEVTESIAALLDVTFEEAEKSQANSFSRSGGNSTSRPTGKPSGACTELGSRRWFGEFFNLLRPGSSMGGIKLTGSF